MMKCEWILCPVCGSKTRNKIRKDTVLENYPLYCPKCRQERLIKVDNLKITVIKEPEGVLHIPEGAEETAKDLILQLRERGFQDDAEITEEVPVQQDKLTIVIPRESLTDTALENLQKITANKQTLFQRAFQTDSTEVEITEEKINFTWFPYTTDSDEIAAYTQFISRLCDMARDAKWVSSKPTETDNDKYAFRCFLLRLGFIGKEYKTARKILLRNLTGNSAFRCGE